MTAWTIESLLGKTLAQFSELAGCAQRYHSPDSIDGPGLRSLVTLEDIDQIVSTQTLVYPMVRVSKSGSMLPASDFTRPSGLEGDAIRYVDTLKLFRCFRDGGTVVFRDMHRYWPALNSLSWGLSNQLGCAVTINGYLTPRETQGLQAHFDYHDLLLVQAAGSKEWYSYQQNAPFPLDNNNWRSVIRSVRSDPPAPDSPIAGVTVLKAGDVMFLPRGSSHAARTTSDISLHLALELQGWTGFDLAQGVLRLVSYSQGLRKGIPFEESGSFRVSRSNFAKAVGDVAALAEDLDLDLARWTIQRDSHVDLFETPVRLVEQYEAVCQSEDGTRLMRRENLLHMISKFSHQVFLHTPDRTLKFPERLEPALKLIMSGSPFTVNLIVSDGVSRTDANRLAETLLNEAILVREP